MAITTVHLQGFSPCRAETLPPSITDTLPQPLAASRLPVELLHLLLSPVWGSWQSPEQGLRTLPLEQADLKVDQAVGRGSPRRSFLKLADRSGWDLQTWAGLWVHPELSQEGGASFPLVILPSFHKWPLCDWSQVLRTQWCCDRQHPCYQELKF